jgi:hypothetical protein
MTLLISNKQLLAPVSPLLPAAFLQLEQWANSFLWNEISYPSSKFSTPTTVQGGQASFLVDPFGFVVLRGYLTTTAGTPTDIGTLPTSASPTSTILVSAGGIFSGSYEQWGLGISPGGVMTTTFQSSNVGDQYYFDGIRFPTF